MPVDTKLENHATAPIWRRQVGLHTARQTGAVTLLRPARAKLLARDPFAPKTLHRFLADLARRRSRVGEILSDRLGCK